MSGGKVDSKVRRQKFNGGSATNYIPEPWIVPKPFILWSFGKSLID